MERNTVLLQDTEAFMHGELDNVTVQQNCITYKVLNISLTTTMATTTRTGGGTIRDIGVRVTGDRVGVIGITRIL